MQGCWNSGFPKILPRRETVGRLEFRVSWDSSKERNSVAVGIQGFLRFFHVSPKLNSTGFKSDAFRRKRKKNFVKSVERNNVWKDSVPPAAILIRFENVLDCLFIIPYMTCNCHRG